MGCKHFVVIFFSDVSTHNTRLGNGLPRWSPAWRPTVRHFENEEKMSRPESSVPFFSVSQVQRISKDFQKVIYYRCHCKIDCSDMQMSKVLDFKRTSSRINAVSHDSHVTWAKFQSGVSALLPVLIGIQSLDHLPWWYGERYKILLQTASERGLSCDGIFKKLKFRFDTWSPNSTNVDRKSSEWLMIKGQTGILVYSGWIENALKFQIPKKAFT